MPNDSNDGGASSNSNGALLVPTSGRHGIDIASQRMDDLDFGCVMHAKQFLELRQNQAVDLGCGIGAEAIRLANVGMSVLMIDLLDLSPIVNEYNSQHGCKLLSSLQKNAVELVPEDLPTQIDILYSQRFIHYLTYTQASMLLKLFSLRMRAETSHLFISASGLDSELGLGYTGADIEIQSRYFPLRLDIAKKHQIQGPVCLYKLSELVCLANEQGFDTVRTWTSPFGNVKGVFRRTP